MKAFLKARDGDGFEAAVKFDNGVKHDLSTHLIDVHLGERNVFFYPTEYCVTGFSLSIDELKRLLADAEKRLKNEEVS